MRAVLALGAVLLLVIHPRLSFMTPRFYNVDEATTAVCARVIQEGGLLYRDVVDSRPPLIHWLYTGLLGRDSTETMLRIHAALIGCIAVTATVIFLAGCAANGLASGFLAGVLFSIGSFNYRSWDVAAFHTEWLMIAFTSSAALALLVCWRRGGDARFAAAAGACSALAVLSKQPALLDAAAGILTFAVLCCRPGVFGMDRRRAWACFASYVAALAVVCAICALYFVYHGAFREFWFYVWTYNVQYHVGIVPVSQRLLSLLTNLYEDDTYLNDNSLLVILALVFAVKTLKRFQGGLHVSDRGVDRDALVQLYIGSWAAAAYVGASISGRGLGWGHYFFQILPPFCVAGGVILAQWASSLRSYIQSSYQIKWVSFGLFRLSAGQLSTAFFTIVLYAVYAVINLCATPPSAPHWRLAPWIFPPYSLGRRAGIGDKLPIETKELYRYLASQFKPGDSMFVWGFNAEYYVRSGYRPASRYVYCNHLTGLIPWVNRDPKIDTTDQILPGAWDALMSDLERSKPRFILDLSKSQTAYRKYPVNKFPRLEAFLNDHYIKESEDLHSSLYLYRRRAL